MEQTLNEIEQRHLTASPSNVEAKYECYECHKYFAKEDLVRRSHEFGNWDYCKPCCEAIDQRNIEIGISSCIPRKFHSLETDRIDVLNECSGKNVFIYGGSGTGKSVFAASIAKQYIRKKKSVNFLSYPAFIMELQSSFRKDEEDPFEIARSVATFAGVLIIDDLGAEKLTDFVRQITYFILNEREQRELRTIITSNFSLADLDAQVDPRISSRIAGMCKVLKFTGADRRVKR